MNCPRRNDPTIDVRFFGRKPGPGMFSLERVFADVRGNLPEGFAARVMQCPYESRGLWNRIRNVLWARRNAGRINHITGDVHYLSLGLPRNRTLLTLHDCVGLVRNKGFKRWVLWLLWYRVPVWSVRGVTAVSEFTKEQVLENIRCDAARIRVIHDPASPLFKPKPRPFNSREPIVLQIGTIWNKNLERVAVALKGIPCRLEIVGLLKEAQRRLLVAGGISYSNHVGVSDEVLLSLYESCDLVIFASLYEGFGLPIIEGQAVGRPVITSNRCSMPEVAGDAACFVDPESVESIRQGIVKVLEDRSYRESLIEKGFENVKRFEPVSIAAQYAKLYRGIASNEL